MADDLVFSTKGGKTDKKKQKSGGFTPSDGPTRMRLESKGRGGKVVTVLFELSFDQKAAKTHMKNMQALFGCGATLKNGTIELRGDVCAKVQDYLSEQGVKVVRSGG